MSEYFNQAVVGILLGLSLLTLVGVAWLVNTARRTERKLDAVLRHSRIDIGEIALAEARKHLAAGKKVEAIRTYREYTGCGLAEAKAKVESLQHPA